MLVSLVLCLLLMNMCADYELLCRVWWREHLLANMELCGSLCICMCLYTYMWGAGGVSLSLIAPSVANVSKANHIWPHNCTIVQLRVCSKTKVVMEMCYCYIIVIDN